MPIGWDFTYPTEKGQVLPEITKTWEKDQQTPKPKDFTLHALPDFVRSFTINGENVTADVSHQLEEFSQLVDNFVNKAEGSSKKHQSLKAWLKSRGGQDVLTFLASMPAEGFIGEKGMAFKGVTPKGNWYLDDEKKICLKFFASIKAVVNVEKNEAIFMDGPRSIKSTIDDERLMQSGGLNDRSHFLTLNASIRLEGIREWTWRIIPVMTHLKIICEDETYLKSPAALFEPSPSLRPGRR